MAIKIPEGILKGLKEYSEDLKPNEGLGELYAYESDKVDQAFLFPKELLESTPVGVKLNEDGEDVQSSIQHYNLIKLPGGSEKNLVAWFHSHPIETPSKIDKTTQKLAQLFRVKYGVFLNLDKMEEMVPPSYGANKHIIAFNVNRGGARQVEIETLEKDVRVLEYDLNQSGKNELAESVKVLETLESFSRRLKETMDHLDEIKDQKLASSFLVLKATLGDVEGEDAIKELKGAIKELGQGRIEGLANNLEKAKHLILYG